jgi:putative transposase
MTAQNTFKYFKTLPKIIRLALMYYIRYPLSFRQVEDILHERGIDICHGGAVSQIGTRIIL